MGVRRGRRSGLVRRRPLGVELALVLRGGGLLRAARPRRCRPGRRRAGSAARPRRGPAAPRRRRSRRRRPRRSAGTCPSARSAPGRCCRPAATTTGAGRARRARAGADGGRPAPARARPAARRAARRRAARARRPALGGRARALGRGGGRAGRQRRAQRRGSGGGHGRRAARGTRGAAATVIAGAAVTATAAVESTTAAFSPPTAKAPAPGAAGGRLRAGEPGDDRPRGERGGGGAHRRTGAMEQHPHRAVGDAELGAHVAVAAALDGDAEQRLALLERQRGDAVERAPHVVAPLDLRVEVAGAGRVVEQLDVGGARALDGVDRAVVDDAEEPGAQVADLGAGAEPAPRADERRLDDVLGARLARDPAGVADQRAPVALDDRLERALGSERGETRPDARRSGREAGRWGVADSQNLFPSGQR